MCSLVARGRSIYSIAQSSMKLFLFFTAECCFLLFCALIFIFEFLFFSVLKEEEALVAAKHFWTKIQLADFVSGMLSSDFVFFFQQDKFGSMPPRKGKAKEEQPVVSLGPQAKEGELVFGVAHIFASFNDTFVHVTDISGWFYFLRRLEKAVYLLLFLAFQQDCSFNFALMAYSMY